MRCEVCDQADRAPVRRAKMVEREGRVAVVTGVPMEECPSCGERWLTLEIAETLDGILRRLHLHHAGRRYRTDLMHRAIQASWSSR